MEYVDRYKVIREENPNRDLVKQELSQYKYDGLIDFCNLPVCTYDVDNKMVLHDPEPIGYEDLSAGKTYILKDETVTPIKQGKIRSVQMETIKFSPDHGLQDYFDKMAKRGDVEIIIFYLYPDFPDTVFHPGYKVRATALCSVK